jgi:hypothetical protein
MCKLCSIRQGQPAIRKLLAVRYRQHSTLPGEFTDNLAPSIRPDTGGRDLATVRWARRRGEIATKDSPYFRGASGRLLRRAHPASMLS